LISLIRKTVLGKAVFPISYLSIQLAMTGLLVVSGLLGESKLAADVGIVQAAALALFFAFSGNARSVIFQSADGSVLRALLVSRLILLVPLGLLAFYFGSVVGGVPWAISTVLVVRKCVEWIGEIHLCKIERQGQLTQARVHLAMQAVLLAFVVAGIVSHSELLFPALIAWALVPLLFSATFVVRTLRAPSARSTFSLFLLPHLGSSAVTGIGVYVFRLTIALLVGKSDAGLLFTGFALGSLLGSMFTYGFGPSMALSEHQSGSLGMPLMLKRILAATAGIGLIITLCFSAPVLSQVLSADHLLVWKTLGISLVGSVVMVFAQRQRLRDLQHGTQEDVFAPDVLVNIIIVIFIPTIFFVFGLHGLTWLYLFNASVAFVFYWMMDAQRASKVLAESQKNLARAVIAFFLIAPIFVTLDSGLFRSPEFLYDSGGVLSKLPIPLSVFACYVGIALMGNYRRANLGLAVLFGTFVLMVISTVATTSAAQSFERDKLFLLLQYLLPMFALALGMMYEDHKRNRRIVEKTAVIMIALLMPTQLLATWFQGMLFLTPYLYIFSVYQHLQYVPVIFASIYVISLFTLWDERSWRTILVALSPLLGVYVTASASMSAIGLGALGILVFVVRKFLLERNARAVTSTVVIPITFLVAAAAFNGFVSVAAQPEHGIWKAGGGILGSFRPVWDPSALTIQQTTNPLRTGNLGMYSQKLSADGASNVLERIEIWHYYASGITKDFVSFFLGQSQPPERAIWPSAHNYYLDFMYNFGVLAMLPVIALMGRTLWLLIRNRLMTIKSPPVFGLAGVVMILILVESSLKVSLRMPYSGIITFFLWGLLLSRLDVFCLNRVRDISA